MAADLAAALRDQPAVEEAIAWAAVASAVEAVAAAEEVGGNGLSRKKIKSIPIRPWKPTDDHWAAVESRQNKGSLTIDLQVYRKGIETSLVIALSQLAFYSAFLPMVTLPFVC